MLGFGLDLAGYTTGRSSLAVIRSNENAAHATLLRNSVFSRKHNSDTLLENLVLEEEKTLRRCLSLGSVAVDIPIDLQGLPFPKEAKQIWELTLRPIDRELNALRTFADRIGSPVVRFRRIMQVGRFKEFLGIGLFETYPKAGLQKMGICTTGYKGTGLEGQQARSRICRHLNFESAPQIGLPFTHDDIDAVICAITSVAQTVHLCAKNDYQTPSERMPCGYRLLKENPFRKVDVDTQDFEEWMCRYELTT
jgi:predicted nuclease with RNAse H fold